ncbi:MAG: exodeoxyribonuclease VII small subunit [Clostridiaceae bacterium]|nr:exodeoxyribonuclease VII small subunit [Clostridiaceae bacterium]
MDEVKSFEDAVNQLEKIVELLEKGDIPLEESLELFQKGVALSNYCARKLDETEKKIIKLIEENGELKEENFGQEAQ